MGNSRNIKLRIVKEMNRRTKSFIVIYGLYLGWLLSFLYGGSLLHVLFKVADQQLNILLLMMNLIPIVLFGLLRYRHINRETDRFWLKTGIGISFLCSVFFVVAGDLQNSAFFGIILIVAIVTGMAELTFIICSIGWFIRYISVKDMFISMAVIITMANCIVIFCNSLVVAGYEEIAIVLMLSSCGLSYILAIFTPDEVEIKREHQDRQINNQSIRLLSVAFFLFSIGGGVVFEVIHPRIQDSLDKTGFLSVLPYVLSGLLILLVFRYLNVRIEYFLAIATGFIVIGLILFQAMNDLRILLISNFFIESGYAIMDIFMWGLVGLIGFVYNKPYKTIYITMSANVLGVLVGGIISKLLSDTNTSDGSLPALISLICAMLGMVIIPIIYRHTVSSIDMELKNIDKEHIISEQLKKAEGFEILSIREKEVVDFLTQDMTNKRIAKALFISENTLKKHTTNIYRKLGVKNKKELKQLRRMIIE